TIQGGSVFGIYPFNRYRRVELSGGVLKSNRSFNDPTLERTSNDYQQSVFGTNLFQNATFVPLGIAFVEETTIFREFGPLSGRTMRLSYETSPGFGGVKSRQTLDGDVRKYARIGSTGLLAMRLRGFRSWGDVPDFIYFAGNSELRGYDYLQFIGSHTAFANAELRFPFIEAMLTPLGVLGGVRGVFFAGFGGSYFSGQSSSSGACQTNLGQATRDGVINGTFQTTRVGSFTWLKRDPTQECPITYNPQTGLPVLGKPVPVSGLRLVDSRASYG